MCDSELLDMLLTFSQERIAEFKKEKKIAKPISAKYLPTTCILRSLYNQAYFCFYTGMANASLSMVFAIVERVSRDVYKKTITNPKKENRISWEDVLQDISKYFCENKKKKELDAIKVIYYIKKAGWRNKQEHLDVDSILKNYGFPTVKFNTLEKKTESIIMPANSSRIPKHVKDRTFFDITEDTSSEMLQRLSFVIETLHSYID